MIDLNAFQNVHGSDPAAWTSAEFDEYTDVTLVEDFLDHPPVTRSVPAPDATPHEVTERA